MQNVKSSRDKKQVTGVLSALGAYIMWGFLPLYWKLVQAVPATEILAHRMVWSFVFLMCVLLLSCKIKSFLHEVRDLLGHPKQIMAVVLAAVLITLNWLTYIWAVNAEHVVEASLGYYINPLVSVLLGIVVLKEKLSLWRIISFALALTGVLILTIHFGTFPWIALTLALTFGLYGLIKKMTHLGAVTGITLETLLISPLMLTYLAYVNSSGSGAYGNISPTVTGLLMGAGVVTAVPLILFAAAANRLPLSSIGFLQYIAPTLMLILGVFLYHEPFTSVHLATFILIWTALIIFSLAGTKPFVALESQFYTNKSGGKFREGS